MSEDIEWIKQKLLTLQTEICQALETEDGQGVFVQDPWSYANGGGGLSCVLEKGRVIEKAGVNFSHVIGRSLPSSATARRKELEGAHFQAMGVSVVVHPHNPFVPTSHFNVRFFWAIPLGAKEPIWWCGGGFDLTPYYGFKEDCRYWHQMAKFACDPFGCFLYARFKSECDEYFYLKHRKEARGIGGIFFDDFNELGLARSVEFLISVGEHYRRAYQEILVRRKNIEFSVQHKEFQRYRRGRYVEFNLVYDRGTLFGLQSGGRTESILMSLPPEVTWHYNFSPTEGSVESRLKADFLEPRDWLLA